MLAALVVVLGVAGTASANSIVGTWISTSGAGVGVGTSTLTGVNIGDTAVLRIRVNASAAGVNAVGVVFTYSAAVLGGAAEIRCPNDPGFNLALGICGTNFSGLLTTISNAVNTGTMIGGVQTDGVPPGGQNTAFTFAHMTFTAVGAGTTGTLFYRPGIDGIVDTSSNFVLSPLVGASITVVPEPGTIALVALGLGALAYVGRRRS